MKIALIGYGKMGRMIEKIAIDRGHEIVAVIDHDNRGDMDGEGFGSADVAIEFTRPDAARENVLRCFERGVPVVCGTTGWNASLPEMERICNEGAGTLMQASNFSVGVNIFMALNRYAAEIMNAFPQYHASMEEVHHVHKLDHPSGTAVTLAENIIGVSDSLDSWTEPEGASLPENVLPIAHERRGEVPGIHSVTWDSAQDSITLTHSAKGREGFALGAVLAAEWLADKQGFRKIDEMYDQIISKPTSR